MQNNAVQKGVNLDGYSSTLSIPYVYNVFKVQSVPLSGDSVPIFIGVKGWSHLGCYVASSLSASFQKILSADAVEMGIDTAIAASEFKLGNIGFNISVDYSSFSCYFMSVSSC